MSAVGEREPDGATATEGRGEAESRGGRAAGLAATGALLAAGAAGAAASFHPHAVGWDPALYTWAVDADLMPHAPYLGYVLLGELVSRLLPTALGLALISSAAHLLAIFGLRRLLTVLGVPGPAPFLAALVYAALPIVQFTAGVQEVYAPAVALVLWSLAWLLSGRPVRSGLAFAGALTIWTGVLLTLPAFAVAHLLQSPPRAGRIARWLAPVASVAAVALAVLHRLFAPYAGRGLEFTDWFRGIGLGRGVVGVRGWLSALRREAVGVFQPDVVGAPLAVALLAAAGLLVCLWRRPRVAVVAVAWGLAYALLESVVGRNVDRGLYAVFLGPGLALFAGCALALPAERLRGVRPAALLAALGLFVAGTRSARLAVPRDELADFDGAPHVVALRWIAEHLPADVYVVEPAAAGQAMLAPSLHLRRPLLFYRGVWCELAPYGRRVPLHPVFFRPLDDWRLAELLAGPAPVLALDRALAERFPWVTFVPYRSAAAPFDLLRVVGPGGTMGR